MSKYNLIDIYEQYKIGSGWTTDFDYEGMLNAGLKATLEDRIEDLEALAEDFTDVNYHREASHLFSALEALEKGDTFEAEGKISDFHAEIRKTMEGFDMDMSDDLGAFMASKMDLDEGDAVDLAIEVSQEKAGIKEAKPGYNEDGTPKSNDEMGDDEREDFYNDLDSVDEGSIDKVSMKDVVLALIKDAKATNLEIESYVKSLKQAGDEFDSVDDYVEDFKEYVSNKSLSEHFGRFMKDYQ